MRNANGTGCVTKLSGARRKPWAFKVTIGYERDEKTGKWKQKTKVLGTYAKKSEAVAAQAQWILNKDPNALVSTPTFADIYERFMEEREKAGTSEQTLKTYYGSYKKCEALYNREINTIRLEDLQKIIDADPTAGGNIRLKVLFNGMWSYAHKNDYVRDNKVTYLQVKGNGTRSTIHYRFSADELDVLWAHEGHDTADFLLVSCYTGLRPKELRDARKEDIDVEKRSLYIPQGKTVNARRTVPFPDKVWPIIQRHMDQSPNGCIMTDVNGKIIDFTADKYISYKVTMKEWGILDYVHPEVGPQEHLPYDGRHTFQSMWGDLRLDNAMMEYLVGHTPKSIGKRVYTHYDPEALRAEMNKL